MLVQRNDYSVKSYHYCTSYEQIWLDNAGDRPKDIRAWRFQGQMKSTIDTAIVEDLKQQKMLVFRAVVKTGSI